MRERLLSCWYDDRCDDTTPPIVGFEMAVYPLLLLLLLLLLSSSLFAAVNTGRFCFYFFLAVLFVRCLFVLGRYRGSFLSFLKGGVQPRIDSTRRVTQHNDRLCSYFLYAFL